MADLAVSYRCSICNINYPAFRLRCDACGEKCSRGLNGPLSHDWEARVAAIKDQQDENDAPAMVRVVAPENVRSHDGQLWIHSWDEKKLRDGQVFSVEDVLYEVWGWRESTREWWVGVLDPVN